MGHIKKNDIPECGLLIGQVPIGTICQMLVPILLFRSLFKTVYLYSNTNYQMSFELLQLCVVETFGIRDTVAIVVHQNIYLLVALIY